MSHPSLSGKVFVVTGGVSGIVLATVQQLLASGASVNVGNLQEHLLQENIAPLQARFPDQMHYDVLNVTDRRAVRSFIETTKVRSGLLHGYAQVARMAGRRLGHENIYEISDEEYDAIMNVNTRGTFIALGELLKPGVLFEPGVSIVCVANMFSSRGFKKGAVYAASKHATVGFVKSAALEAGARGIRVNAVLPGAIDTPMHQRNMSGDMPDTAPGNPIPRVGAPEEVAEVIVFLLSEHARYITGSEYAVDGGANT